MLRSAPVMVAMVLGLAVSWNPARADRERPFSGVVEEVLPAQTEPQDLVQVRVRLETGGTVLVHLAPSWYLQQLWVSPEPGDTMEITGARETGEEDPIIASRISLGEEIIFLRAEGGSPLWTRLASTATP